MANLKFYNTATSQWENIQTDVTADSLPNHASNHQVGGSDVVDVTLLKNYNEQISTPITNLQNTNASLQNTANSLQTTQTNHENRISTIEDENLDTRVKTLETAKTNDENRLTVLENNAVTFITPTLLNGWVPNSTGSAFYWKDRDGIVHYKLVLKNGGTGVNTTIMVFPSGYLPDREYLEVGYCEGTGVTDHTALFHVSNSPGLGELKLMRDIGGNSLLILSGSFKAVA
ncbi:MAG: hypothetical protein Q8880_13715 [Bacteroidota bacterium]|nr:hypothetical protein [Bacteroidota bacterium]